MRILLIGSGGREHALAWKLAQSPQVDRIFAVPGNPGIAEHAELLDLDTSDQAALLAAARSLAIDLVIVGPEQPLVAGLADLLNDARIPVFGPTAAAARLEGSKGFTKDLCAETGIPTAKYRRFSDLAAALAYVKATGAPIVIKADGLAAGKGVVVADTLAEAEEAISACFSGSFGAAGIEVVIEEKLVGVEASLFALSDGERVIPFGTAQDYKRVGDGDTGPNTGGMGAISPAPALTPELVEEAMAKIVRPTVAAMRNRGTPFRGILYAGLMLTAEGPQLIEYNVRFGDPECQVLMLRLTSDLAGSLAAAARGDLATAEPTWSADVAVTVVMAARGYPGPYAKGSVIDGLHEASALPGVTVFQAGTAVAGTDLVAAGGRVLNVSASGFDAEAARTKAYGAVDTIRWPGGFCRRDVGV